MSNQELKPEAFFNIGETSQINFEDKINEKKEESQDNFDNLAFDKKLWNLGGDIQYPDLSLKKESESKLSIDIPDISKQRLKEYLNEDLLNEIDISPKTTPKNIIKDATFNNNFDFNNNNENNENNETINITNITDDKNIFQFSLYNNNDNNKNENDEDKYEKESNEINKIKEDEGGGNINNNLENIIENNINKINEIKISENEEKKIEQIKQKEQITKKENIEIKDNKEISKEIPKEKEVKKNNNYYQTQTQYQQYKYPYIQIPYITQPIVKSINQFGHENKFDGNKKYQLIVPFTVLKKNIKTKKPFEIREGDWTCSNCNNLNFSFRVKCNRCDIAKEQSELNKNNKENKEQKYNNQNKNKSYYSNVNMIQYKYYPGYIYVPIQQGQFNKKEKK